MKNSTDDHLTDVESGGEGETCEGKNGVIPRKLQTVREYITEAITSQRETSSFMVTNLANVAAQYALWMRELPFVEPMYAVKCNPNIEVIRCLANLGCGFDCATRGEIKEVGQILRSTPCRRKRIIYAQPAKMDDHLRYALKQGVTMMVFDGEEELFKISQILHEIDEEETKMKHKSDSGVQPAYGREARTSRRSFLSAHWSFKPEASLLLRIATADEDSMCQFSNKFGCNARKEGKRLLELAHSLGLHVAGVSFHVGSGCQDPHAYTSAIQDAEHLFRAADSLGMPPMTVLDIGGGFPGDAAMYYNDGDMPSFGLLAATIRDAVADFETSLGIQWAQNMRYIAEPGRFFVSASTTLATRVHSVKSSTIDGVTKQALYVDDGVYGTFNNVVYDHYEAPPPKPLLLGRDVHAWAKQRVGVGATVKDGDVPTAVFGPTCDGLDQLCEAERCSLPRRLDVGDWLLWDCMGAYTHTASFDFNGYDHKPKTHTVFLSDT